MDRLARHIASGPAERPHADRDLVSTQVVRIVTDEIGGEGLKDRGPTARRGPHELPTTKDVMASGGSDSESAAADGVATEATTEAGTVSGTWSTKV